MHPPLLREDSPPRRRSAAPLYPAHAAARCAGGARDKHRGRALEAGVPAGDRGVQGAGRAAGALRLEPEARARARHGRAETTARASRSPDGTLGVPVTVVLPANAPASKEEGLRKWGPT